MPEVKEVKEQDIFKRKIEISNPWLDPNFNKVESLGGEPGFKVDDIPERLGLVLKDKIIYLENRFVGIVQKTLQANSEAGLDQGFWSKTGSTVYYKLGKVAIGHAAPEEIFHIAKGEETIASRISCKISPWRQWECLDSDYGFALGIAADDKKFHFHYDTPMGTVSVHLMCLDGDNSKVGILQDSPSYPFDVNGAGRFDDLYLNDTNASHVALLHWNEDEASANRILNFTLSGGDRTFALHGNLTVEAASLINQDLTTDARATFAGIDSTSYIKLSSNNELRFYDNGNYVGFEAPALSADQIWVLPAADGPANEVLGTDNSGNLIWRTHDELASYVAKEHRAWEDSIVQNVHDDNILSSAITQHEGDINHDALTNYEADEHLPALDEDDLVSDSDTNVATQQSIKAYVDVATSDKIEEGDSSVEVVDAGTGYIETKADNQQVRKDQVVGNIQPLQPAFLAYNSAVDEDVTGDNTVYKVTCDTEVFDQGGNFATGTFTAPVTGRYYLSACAFLLGLHVDTYEQIQVHLVTSNRTFVVREGGAIYDAWGQKSVYISALVDMDANDTVDFKVNVLTGTKSVDVEGGAAPTTWFSGALIC